MAEQAQAVLKKIEDQTKWSFLPIIGPDKGKILEMVVKEKKPKEILEVGTLVGYSAILMARNLPDDGKITTIEINKDFAKIAQKNITASGFGNKIQILVGDAKEVINTLSSPFDILFLDGAKEEYLTYLKLAEPRLSPGAVVIADNVKVFAVAVADYLEYVRRSGKYQSQTFDFGGDAVEVSWLALDKENPVY